MGVLMTIDAQPIASLAGFPGVVLEDDTITNPLGDDASDEPGGPDDDEEP